MDKTSSCVTYSRTSPTECEMINLHIDTPPSYPSSSDSSLSPSRDSHSRTRVVASPPPHPESGHLPESTLMYDRRKVRLVWRIQRPAQSFWSGLILALQCFTVAGLVILTGQHGLHNVRLWVYFDLAAGFALPALILEMLASFICGLDFGTRTTSRVQNSFLCGVRIGLATSSLLFLCIGISGFQHTGCRYINYTGNVCSFIPDWQQMCRPLAGLTATTGSLGLGYLAWLLARACCPCRCVPA